MQNYKSFEVIFVDFGSSIPNAALARQTVEKYPFCRYVYNDTRGYPWNRSWALNTGARLTSANFTLTTDVDIIFPPDFLEIAMQNARQDRVLYCAPHLLPKGFSDWRNISSYVGKFPMGGSGFKGGCQLISRDVFQRLEGFDENYRYWGIEDRDFNLRMLASGLEEMWLSDRTAIFHQWHEKVNYNTRNVMPEGYWGRMTLYTYTKSTLPQGRRNWGKLYTTEERKIFSFLDFENKKLADLPNLILFTEPAFKNYSVGSMVQKFCALPAGSAMAIHHAFYPELRPFLDHFLELTNKALALMNINTRLDYGCNRLHSYLAEFIENSTGLISDYYLGFPHQDGVSLIMRA